MKQLLLLLALVLGIFPQADAMGRRSTKYLITFHAQGMDMESPRSIFRWQLPGRSSPTVFKKVPEFTHKDIAAFHSFRSEDGQSNGVTLRLDFRGTNALQILTRTKQGEVLLVMFNGVPVDYLSIDAPVQDGIVTVWKGVSDEAVAQMKKEYPPIEKLDPVSKGDKDMIGTTVKEKERVMEDYKRKAEQERIEANKAARKAEADALKGEAPKEAPPPQLPLLPQR